MEKNANAVKKTRVYNLIILDESGSMSGVAGATIAGCNEVINGVKSTQKTNAANQEHLISIYAFQSDGELPSRYIIKNVPAAGANHISDKDYSPWGCTPLYDAIGSTLSELKAISKMDPDMVASVTIITDGMENSSTDYTHAQVVKLISQLTDLGWNFNFIGANIDAAQVSASLNIDNSLQFDQSEEGVKEMWDKFNDSRDAYSQRLCEMDSMPCSAEERILNLKKVAKCFFTK